MRIDGGPFLGAVIAALLSGPAIEAGDGSEALWTRLRRIQSDFRSGDAPSLRTSFSSTTRLRVDLEGFTDRRASYAPGQLQVIFGEIFEEHRTREMNFERNDVTLSPGGTAFARGRWVRRPKHGGAETVDSLTFTLREEGGDWRILEIRSSR